MDKEVYGILNRLYFHRSLEILFERKIVKRQLTSKRRPAAIAAIDVRTKKTVSAANTLVNKERLAKIRLKIKALRGTPFFR